MQGNKRTMKRLLKNVALFLSPFIFFIFLFGIFIIVVSSSVNEFEIDPHVSEIFIGDSHIQVAINDSLFTNCKNYGMMAESYYFSFYKLKLILSSNPEIRKVYLGFSYHNLSDYYEEYIFGEFSGSISPNYFFIIPFKEQIKLLSSNSNELVGYMKDLIRKGVRNIINDSNYTFSGGFSNKFMNTSASAESMEKRIFTQYYSKEKLNEFSKTNMFYFHKIVDLCKTKGIELTLINMPIHRFYKSMIPEEYLSEYSEIPERSNLSLLDLSDLIKDDNYFIPDGDHVSAEGATEVSNYVKSLCCTP